MLTRKAMFLGLFGVALAAFFSLQRSDAAQQPVAPGGSARTGNAQDGTRHP